MGLTIYDEETWNKILELHSEGQTITSICKMEGMPSRTLLDLKLDSDKDYLVRFARARLMACDGIADEALRIADTPVDGVEITDSDQNGRTVTTKEMLHHRRLQIETRLKLIAKWAPSKYGDKLDVTSNGKALNQTVIVNDSKTAEDVNNVEG